MAKKMAISLPLPAPPSLPPPHPPFSPTMRTGTSLSDVINEEKTAV
jgi:hypothetical protein